MAVTHESPLLARIGAWSLERYPPPITVINILVYFTVAGVAKMLLGQEVIDFSVERDLLGAIAFSCFPLMIRVFDEHKDYEEDVHNHPDRILQRGIITLGHLKVVGAIAIGLQLGISIYLDGGFGLITQAWLVVMGWSLLMAKEFFLGRMAREAALSLRIYPPACVTDGELLDCLHGTITELGARRLSNRRSLAHHIPTHGQRLCNRGQPEIQGTIPRARDGRLLYQGPGYRRCGHHGTYFPLR